MRLKVQLQLDALNSNFKNFESIMKSVNMPLSTVVNKFAVTQKCSAFWVWAKKRNICTLRVLTNF